MASSIRDGEKCLSYVHSYRMFERYVHIYSLYDGQLRSQATIQFS